MHWKNSPEPEADVPWADTLASPHTEGQKPAQVPSHSSPALRPSASLEKDQHSGDQIGHLSSSPGHHGPAVGPTGPQPCLCSRPGPGRGQSRQQGSGLLPAAVALSRPGRPRQPSQQTPQRAAWGSGSCGGGGQDQVGRRAQGRPHSAPMVSVGCPRGPGLGCLRGRSGGLGLQVSLTPLLPWA